MPVCVKGVVHHVVIISIVLRCYLLKLFLDKFMSMEGHLYKWGGYISGWQRRFCVVNNGQLDFYESKISMQKGKAVLESFHISYCEITVDSKSQLTWDIKVSGCPTIYLKTDSPLERKRWLQILGSAKACMADTSALVSMKIFEIPSKKHSESNTESRKLFHVGETLGPGNLPPTSNQRNWKLKELSSETHDSASVSSSHSLNLDESQNEYKTESTNSEDGNESFQSTSSQTLDEELSFICDKMKDELSDIQKHYCHHDDKKDRPKELLHEYASKVFTLFNKFSGIVLSITNKPLERLDADDLIGNGDHVSLRTTDSGFAESCQRALMPHSSTVSEAPDTPRKVALSTFFNSVKVSFKNVLDEAYEFENPELLCSIKTETYITACIEFTKFFDHFAGTLLSPLKSDILSNSEKVRKAFMKNPKRYVYMQPIFDDEIARKEHLHPDCATQAVLWMMRGLRTISQFLIDTSTPSDENFKKASEGLDAAYRKHLKRYHNFVVQRMFIMGLKLVPSFEHFMKQITFSDVDLHSPEVENEVLEQTNEYCRYMAQVVSLIEKVYIHHNIKL